MRSGQGCRSEGGTGSSRGEELAHAASVEHHSTVIHIARIIHHLPQGEVQPRFCPQSLHLGLAQGGGLVLVPDGGTVVLFLVRSVVAVVLVAELVVEVEVGAAAEGVAA